MVGIAQWSRWIPVLVPSILFVSVGSSLFAENLSTSDKDFLKGAMQSGMAEVDMADLAQNKTGRPDIKMFATQISADRKKMNDQLIKVATANSFKLPDGPGLKFNAEKARLKLLSGRDFDFAYVNAMVDDHTTDISMFEKAGKDVSDSDLKRIANQSLPVLKEHLNMIKTIQGTLSGGK
jgi:putative membrane protein